MSKIMVMGPRGMLGHEIVKVGHGTIIPMGGDISDASWLSAALASHHIDVVINCAGVHNTYGRGTSTPKRMISSNAIGPNVLAEVCELFGRRLIHVSTDCVFSGKLGLGLRYNTYQTPDPIDMYGRSKLLGEVEADHVTNVRTSFIGLDHGLMAWFLSRKPDPSVGAAIEASRPEVPGWVNAMWSGSTVDEVARRLVTMADDPPGGIVHLATDKSISKDHVLRHIRDQWPEYEQVRIVETHSPRINRALIPNVEPLPHIESALARYRLERDE